MVTMARLLTEAGGQCVQRDALHVAPVAHAAHEVHKQWGVAGRVVVHRPPAPATPASPVRPAPCASVGVVEVEVEVVEFELVHAGEGVVHGGDGLAVRGHVAVGRPEREHVAVLLTCLLQQLYNALIRLRNNADRGNNGKTDTG